ncbi:hypothetical protein ACFSLT_23240 [Novosphingobium resinovorum]
MVQIHNMMLRGILRRPDDALRRRVIADIAAASASAMRRPKSAASTSSISAPLPRAMRKDNGW